MHKYMEKGGEVTFEKIFFHGLGKTLIVFYLLCNKIRMSNFVMLQLTRNDLLYCFVTIYVRYDLCTGYLLFKDFCENCCEEPVPQMTFYDEV